MNWFSTKTTGLVTSPKCTRAIVGPAIAFVIAVEVFLVQGSPIADAVPSLLIGFAPIVELCALFVIVVQLYSSLLCAVEETLGRDEEDTLPEPDRRRRWLCVSDDAFSLLPAYLSLREHSPPALLLA